MAELEDRVALLERNYAVMESNIHGRLESIDEKLALLVEGKAGNCIREDARLKRVEERQDYVYTTMANKVDKEFVTATSDLAAKAVVALALVEAEKQHTKVTDTLNTKMNGLYLLLSGIAITIVTFSILHFMGKL